MQDYSISKCSRKCAVSGRQLEAGESYISTIVPDGDNVKRMDIAATEWHGPRDETIGWWRSRMPSAGPKTLRPAPNGVLLDTLSELLERPGQESLAYLLALLLVRRRVLQEEDSIEHELSANQSTHWCLVCKADGRKWNVTLCEPPEEELGDLNSELNELLFTEE